MATGQFPGSNPYNAGNASGNLGAPPNIPNYLIQAILVTLCCCIPFGIVSIVYAAQVNSKIAAGDIAGAQASSANAKKWCLIGLISGIVANIIVIGLQIALAVASQQSGGGF